jgi:hypothetical protein
VRNGPIGGDDDSLFFINMHLRVLSDEVPLLRFWDFFGPQSAAVPLRQYGFAKNPEI